MSNLEVAGFASALAMPTVTNEAAVSMRRRVADRMAIMGYQQRRTVELVAPFHAISTWSSRADDVSQETFDPIHQNPGGRRKPIGLGAKRCSRPTL